jgi:hypothetical protein
MEPQKNKKKLICNSLETPVDLVLDVQGTPKARRGSRYPEESFPVTPTPKRSFPTLFNFINMVESASTLEKEDDATTISSAASSISPHHESGRLTKDKKRRREAMATDLTFAITQNSWKQLLGRIAKLETTVALQAEDYNKRQQRYKRISKAAPSRETSTKKVKTKLVL